MAAQNMAVAGDYTGAIGFKNLKKGLILNVSFRKKILINKETVDYFEVVGEEQYRSFGSGVAKGIAGAALFGGIGAIAGASSAKSKTNHMVSIVFKDGTKCLCELDDFMFKNLVKILY